MQIRKSYSDQKVFIYIAWASINSGEEYSQVMVLCSKIRLYFRGHHLQCWWRLFHMKSPVLCPQMLQPPLLHHPLLTLLLHTQPPLQHHPQHPHLPLHCTDNHPTTQKIKKKHLANEILDFLKEETDFFYLYITFSCIEFVQFITLSIY